MCLIPFGKLKFNTEKKVTNFFSYFFLCIKKGKSGLFSTTLPLVFLESSFLAGGTEKPQLSHEGMRILVGCKLAQIDETIQSLMRVSGSLGVMWGSLRTELWINLFSIWWCSGNNHGRGKFSEKSVPTTGCKIPLKSTVFSKVFVLGVCVWN